MAYSQTTGSQKAPIWAWPTFSLRSSGMRLDHCLLPAQQTPPPPLSSKTLNAARLDQGMQSTQVRVVPTAQRVSEEGGWKDQKSL
ncbi:hypothetical protein Q4I28_006295 [Leishmania naiffi]|uniref:Uncharacterized protein n=1 Tax=Leishmania naiffi TaxID=5678 RepID=A0AAW3BGF6_9TRYP